MRGNESYAKMDGWMDGWEDPRNGVWVGWVKQVGKKQGPIETGAKGTGRSAAHSHTISIGFDDLGTVNIGFDDSNTVTTRM
jgi:hypothetical protein